MEIVTLLVFTAELIACLLLHINLIYALILGYLIFLSYALLKGYSLKTSVSMSLDGVKTVKGILITFILIGILTGAWRVGGTIPVIISYAAGFITPGAFLLLVFILNCLISFLTGTSFGTAATMGAICMTMSRTMGTNPVITGGAVLSGIFFGDRCSPVSTSAMLVAELTKTDIYDNIKGMLKTCIVPFAMTVVIYLLLGMQSGRDSVDTSAISVFQRNFTLSPFGAIPALLILLLAALRVKVKKTLFFSTLAACICALFVEGVGLIDLVRVLIFGFHPADHDLSLMLSGGGGISMFRNMVIVCISSSFSGIFNGTGMLKGLKASIASFGRRVTPFMAVLVTSIVTALIACNQTLTIMLTHDLCDTVVKDEKSLAIDLENTAVLIAALVPWSIAGSAALLSAGADTSSIPYGFYLYLVPFTQLIYSFMKREYKK